MPTEEEIAKIIELHNNNYSQGQIAKELGRSKSTINEWLHKILNGERFANEDERKKNQTKNATEARITYTRERRLALNDLFYDRICEMTKAAKSSRDLKDLAISFGIIEDKRHLLEPMKADDKGIAALDSFVEDMKREASENESEATPKHPIE